MIALPAETLPSQAAEQLTLFQGIFYLIGHRTLWRPFLSRLVPTLTLSAGVVASMFFFTYLPQLVDPLPALPLLH